MATSTNYPNLKAGGPGYREGRIQKAIRRLLIAADGKPVTTAEMMQVVWLRGEAWTESRWRHTRRAAERHAERVPPRLRPLKWRMKPPQNS